MAILLNCSRQSGLDWSGARDWGIRNDDGDSFWRGVEVLLEGGIDSGMTKNK